MANANATRGTKPVQDRRGFVSGRLTVIGPWSRRGRRIFWLCQCACGNTKEVVWDRLKSGHATNCGCVMIERQPIRAMPATPGQVYGLVTLIAPVDGGGKHPKWIGRCDCGAEREFDLGNLRYGKTRSCGCIPKGSVPGQQRDVIDLSGRRYGLLTIIRRAANRGYKVRWVCRCDCGVEREFDIAKVKSGRARSCGCTHSIRRGGKSKTREYRIWTKMRDRCYSPNVDNYRFYGARGTVVCEAWRGSFDNFFSDMGAAPSDKHTLDRINPHGNYSCGYCDECKQKGWPANCRWATKLVQSRNCKKHVRVTHNGETRLLKEWAELSGIGYHVLYSRFVVHGWSFEDAISTPVRKLRVPRRAKIPTV